MFNPPQKIVERNVYWSYWQVLGQFECTSPNKIDMLWQFKLSYNVAINAKDRPKDEGDDIRQINYRKASIDFGPRRVKITNIE